MPRINSRPLSQASPDVLRKFWGNFYVGNPNECWEWLNDSRIAEYGFIHGNGKNWLAHRLSYYIHHGVDPLNLDVCHTCDNAGCVNWNHLFLGTQRDNAQDRHRKGRTVMPTVRAVGEKAPCHKLTEAQVIEMRALRLTGLSYPKLGRLFGVTNQSAYAVVNRVTWKHIL